ncbi:MAG: 4a-hydroxytetrahydrobiopterin dehydratase [Actinobacteria bacterium]|nr:4a-hydroxytetrahydrobiopterin dehydratase [Actinomycetota bacterium]|tara:strand:- start:69 stop:395 length:327 start_codon:yes stop_codon:yes gene_type:complete
MSQLSKKSCVPCQEGVAPLGPEEYAPLLAKLGKGWQVVNHHHLEKEFHFDNFVDALAFVNQVGAIAEQEGHHPNLFLTWGHVKIQIWTHKIDGLSESDFILAAKSDLS